MAKLKDGFYKLTASSIGSDLLVLLAGGGAKPISDFASSFNVKLWGLLFDGSKDVSGGLSGVTSINSDGSVVLIGGATNNYSGARLHTKGFIESTDGYKINSLDVLRRKTDELAVGQETTVYASLPTSVYGTIVELKYGTDRITGFTLNSSGNVGIGTASPSSKLHLYSTENTTLRIQSDGSGGDQGAICMKKASGNGLVFAVENRDFIWQTGADSLIGSGTERMRLTSSGNVGIGTTSPSYKLDVNGSIYGSHYYGNEITLYTRGNGTYTRAWITAKDSAGDFIIEAPLTAESSGTRAPITLTWRGGYPSMGGLKITGYSEAELGKNKIWHAGNDGSGSGLDADLLDGYHVTHFMSYIKGSGYVQANLLNSELWNVAGGNGYIEYYDNGTWFNSRWGLVLAISGFHRVGSSDSYVLLGGGGHKALSDFAMASAYVKKAGDTMTGRLTMTGEGIIVTTATTSNYCAGVEFYKGTAADTTYSYDAQIGWHNIGGDGTGSICILPYATSTQPWGGSVGLFITKTDLKYNGNSVWHSGNDGSGSGLDADLLDGKHASAFALASHGVHWEGFTKRANSNASWGTLISSNGYTPLFWLDSTNTGGVAFSDKSGQTFMQIDGFFYQNEGKYLVLDTNNYSSYTDGRYVNVTGDTMTGNLTVPSLNSYYLFRTTDIAEGAANLGTLATPHTITFFRNGIMIPYKMDNANDGGMIRTKGASESDCIFEMATWDDSGDGETIQFNYYSTTSQLTPTYSNTVPKVSGTLLNSGNWHSYIGGHGYVMKEYTIDATGLDLNTWYPVTMTIGACPNVRIEVRVSLNSGSKPSWSIHGSGFSVRKIWEVNGSGWGTNTVHRTVFVSDYAHASTDPVRGMGDMGLSSTEYVYVRGGGRYYFYTSHNVIPYLRTSTYVGTADPYYQAISPTTTAPGTIAGFLINRSMYASHFYENSDATLKTNIETINTSDNIPQLKSFNWKEDGKHSYGLIAQELEEMGYTELVEESNGKKTVQYSAALSLIVGKLQVKIKELEKEIEILKNKN